MSEDTRAHPGTAADRKSSVKTTAALGLSGGLFVIWAHYGIKLFPSGHFHYVAPDDALIEMTVMAVLPTLHMIGRIINNHLEKLAGEDK